MATSGVEEAAMRLLGAFYDLSGHNPAVEVPIGTPGGRGRRARRRRRGWRPGPRRPAWLSGIF